MIARAEGTLNGSGKPFSLRAFFGSTDLYGPKPPSHWSEALRSMVNDDIFIYAGHSGLGENLRVATLAEQEVQSATRQLDYQLLAYLSCYSYTYFDQDQLPTSPLGGGRARADLLLTAGETYEFGQAALGTLAFVADALAHDGRARLDRHFTPQDFILYRTFKPSRLREQASR